MNRTDDFFGAKIEEKTKTHIFFVQINPQHTVPLLNDNGVYVVDSHAIAAYLCEKYGKNDRLYPKDSVKRSLVDSRLHFDSGHLFCRVRFLLEPVWMLKHAELQEERINYIRTSYDIMERFLAKTPYLCGDELTIADICCVATLSSINRIIPLDSAMHAKLIEWTERMARLPYYKEKNAEGAAMLQDTALKMLHDNLAHKN